MAEQTRPPVITIMGHVDHGKTSLLDYIRKAKVAAGEAGGITQHIGAYQIEFKGKKLTFIDTPGHAAFNKMRERGSKITDIVILVVAANDGVKPQTIESIRHIKTSKASFIVAINKSDLKDIKLDEVRAQLAEHDVIVREFGGEVDTINISAKTGAGIDELLENLVVMSDLLELKADPQKSMEAVVIESTLDAKKGVSASVIVQQGTLAVRQDLITQSTYGNDIVGRVRSLTDENGRQLKEVTPGSPAEIIGLKEVPPVGSIIRDAAAEYTELEEMRELEAEEALLEEKPVVDNDPFADIDFDVAFGGQQKLKLIIRSDVEGTLEVINQNLDEDQVDVVSSGVGMVTESDIELARATGAKIIAFHTQVPGRIAQLAKDQDVKVKSYDVIYKLIEDLQKQILKLIEPGIDEVITGQAEILEIFEMKGERIAGCRVKTGEIKKTDFLHLKRGDDLIADPQIKLIMHGKEEIESVKAKNECGITFRKLAKGKIIPFEVGDTLVAYSIEED
jgi:translation initiation factor IF-2